MNFSEVVKNFNFEGDFINVEPFGNGHINDTFAVSYIKADETVHRYILQKMNTNVFKNIEILMNNVKLVTEFVRQEVINAGGNPNRDCLNLVLTKKEEASHRDEKGNYWRAYILIENTVAHQKVEDAKMFEKVGESFGNFINLLSHFDAEKLGEVIPNFHNTASRFENFKIALNKNFENRKENCKNEIEFVLKRESYCNIVVNKLLSGELPLRVTHNDTKLNNVLMDADTNLPVSVIDLDTIMPGSLLYDFGDAIRSGCNTGLEDEKDLNLVSFSLEYFEAFTKGFLSGVGNKITKTELELLPLGAILMTLECGIRFLGDHLDGDNYFKTHYSEHNLVRCRTQFKLVAEMEKELDKMKDLVKKYADIYSK